jgi:hypothetical protein
VLEFCRSIRPDQQPVYVPIKPVVGAIPRDCYGNVAKKIVASGGSILHGWAIWIEPSYFIEAEHHAIWISPDGQKVDVSPQQKTDKTLFLPDPENTYKGVHIPARLKALTDDPRMMEWIKRSEEIDRLRLENTTPDGKSLRQTSEMTRLLREKLQIHQEMEMPLDDADFDEPMKPTKRRPSEGLTPKQRAEIRKKLRKGKK